MNILISFYVHGASPGETNTALISFSWLATNELPSKLRTVYPDSRKSFWIAALFELSSAGSPMSTFSMRNHNGRHSSRTSRFPQNVWNEELSCKSTSKSVLAHSSGRWNIQWINCVKFIHLLEKNSPDCAQWLPFSNPESFVALTVTCSWTRSRSQRDLSEVPGQTNQTLLPKNR